MPPKNNFWLYCLTRFSDLVSKTTWEACQKWRLPGHTPRDSGSQKTEILRYMYPQHLPNWTICHSLDKLYISLFQYLSSYSLCLKYPSFSLSQQKLSLNVQAQIKNLEHFDLGETALSFQHPSFPYQFISVSVWMLIIFNVIYIYLSYSPS